MEAQDVKVCLHDTSDANGHSNGALPPDMHKGFASLLSSLHQQMTSIVGMLDKIAEAHELELCSIAQETLQKYGAFQRTTLAAGARDAQHQEICDLCSDHAVASGSDSFQLREAANQKKRSSKIRKPRFEKVNLNHQATAPEQRLSLRDAACKPLRKQVSLPLDTCEETFEHVDTMLSVGSTLSVLSCLPSASEIAKLKQAKSFCDCEEEQVQSLVNSGWDPNHKFTDMKIGNKTYLLVTPLAIAVLRNREASAKWLIENRADPDSEYGFIAGVEELQWFAPCSHAAVASGNLVMLKLLLELRADSTRSASNRASLLWQAAYCNKIDVARYLISLKSDIEKKASSQDNKNLTFTPLHIAATAGNYDIASLLLQAKAQVEVVDTDPIDLEAVDHKTSQAPRCPFDDAILNGHSDVARLLVEHGTNLFTVVKARKTVFDHVLHSRHLSIFGQQQGASHHLLTRYFNEAGDMRRLDVCLALNNPILTAAVAKGLERCLPLLDLITRKDFIRFLSSKGRAPVDIMNAVFQPYPIAYCYTKRERKVRFKLKTAFIHSANKLNVALGPHYELLRQRFNARQILDANWTEFVNELAPWTPRQRSNDQFSSVRFYMCHVPEVDQVDVLLAIYECRNDDLFSTDGCKAILVMAAQKVLFSTKLRLCISIVEVFDLVFLVSVLNEPWFTKRFANSAAYISAITFALELAAHMGALMGYWVQGLFQRFLLDSHTMLRSLLLVLFGTCLVYAWSNLRELDEGEDIGLPFRSLLGVLIFIKSMQLLFLLCQFRFAGLRILPITSVFYDIGPFCVVTSVSIFGAATMYYALGLWEVMRSFTIIYRLIMLADVDMAEMEFVPEVDMRVTSDGHINQTLPAKTNHYLIIHFVMFALTFAMSLTLMNLFIAVLNLSYNHAHEFREIHFLRNRAKFMLEAHAMRSARKVCYMICSRRRSVVEVQRDFWRGTRTSANEHPDEDKRKRRFLWVCLPDNQHT